MVINLVGDSLPSSDDEELDCFGRHMDSDEETLRKSWMSKWWYKSLVSNILTPIMTSTAKQRLHTLSKLRDGEQQTTHPHNDQATRQQLHSTLTVIMLVLVTQASNRASNIQCDPLWVSLCSLEFYTQFPIRQFPLSRYGLISTNSDGANTKIYIYLQLQSKQINTTNIINEA